MTDRAVTESVVEQAALAWFESLGYTVKASLRDALLPKIISGELRLPEIKRMIERNPRWLE